MSSYFNFFPILNYTLDDGTSYQQVQDIFRRVTLTYSAQTKGAFAHKYVIKEGETPEILSHKFYRSTHLWWVILLTNEIVDPRFDWPLSQADLKTLVADKYGEDNIYDIHHYEQIIYPDTDAEQRLISDVEDPDYPETISNWEYEDELNEAKRPIRILVPEIVPSVVAAFQNIIRL